MDEMSLVRGLGLRLAAGSCRRFGGGEEWSRRRCCCWRRGVELFVARLEQVLHVDKVAHVVAVVGGGGCGGGWGVG